MAEWTHTWRDQVDPLGLRRVLGDRMLPVLVAAMAFLAALALGGAIAAQDWADRWRLGAATALTAQIPRPTESADAAGATRLERALALLRADPAVASARALSPQELAALLGPWLGDAEAVPGALLPGVIAVRTIATPPPPEALARLAERLDRAVPEASLESHEAWVDRLALLLRGLEACGWGALALVASVAALVIATATRAGLSARRGTVTLLHGLGATDGYIALRFARRAMLLVVLGASLGTGLAIPVLLSLARLSQSAWGDAAAAASADVPGAIWLGLAALPVLAAAIGYATAHGTVWLWLRRLP